MKKKVEILCNSLSHVFFVVPRTYGQITTQTYARVYACESVISRLATRPNDYLEGIETELCFSGDRPQQEMKIRTNLW